MIRRNGESYVRKGSKPIDPDYVLTPGGYRHRSLTHFVSKGRRIERRSDRLRQIDNETGEQMALYARIPKTFPIPDVGANWITFASWSNDSGIPISKFATEIVVPLPPETENGQTIFLFNALEDAAQDDIVQPVLQWGISIAGGGNFWAISNWYIDHTGHASYSRLERVDPGDALTGVVMLSDQTGGTFQYRCSFTGHPELDLEVAGSGELVWAAETLEAYEIGGCNYYPNVSEVSLNDISIETGNANPQISWAINDQVTDCNQASLVTSASNPGGKIVISF